jgi:hypothetical protein
MEGSAMKMPSTKEIQSVCAELQKRRNVVETAVASVVRGFTPALFVWGPPGLGKSHELTILLDATAGKGWRHHTAYSTPRALMMSIAEEPAAIHLFEDCERMMKTDLSASILRAACGAPNDRERIVSYETANETLRVRFTGGIIIATNANLAKNSGPMQGVASRFRPIKWDMTLRERVCMILHLAEVPRQKCGAQISVAESRKVARELVNMAMESRTELTVDLRLFTEHALPAYAMAKSTPGMKWQDLMLSKLEGTAVTEDENQHERTRRLQQLAEKIHLEGGSTKAKIAKWKQITDLGQAIYYRHLKGAKSDK